MCNTCQHGITNKWSACGLYLNGIIFGQTPGDVIKDICCSTKNENAYYDYVMNAKILNPI